MKDLTYFTGLYPVTKTIKLKLEPQGKTLDNLQNGKIIEAAEIIAEKKLELKTYVDKYHRDYINEMLQEEKVKEIIGDRLEDAYELYQKSNSKSKDKDKKKDYKKEYNKLIESLSKDISKYMQKTDAYGVMEKADFVQVILKNHFKDDEQLQELVEVFNGRTGVISDLNKIRKRLYEADNKYGTIVYRIFTDNLPKYFDNVKVYRQLMDSINNGYFCANEKDIDKLKERVGADTLFEVRYFYKYVNQSGIDVYNTLIGGVADKDEQIQGLNALINLHNQKCVDRTKKLPKFTKLYKQLMSMSSTLSFVDDIITTDKEMHELIKDYIDKVDNEVIGLSKFLKTINSYELNEIYINKNDIGFISNLLFGSYHKIEDAIIEDYNNTHPARDKESKTYLEKRKTALNKINCYSIQELNDIVGENITPFVEYALELEEEYDICRRKYERFNFDDNFKANKHEKNIVRGLLDSIIAISRFIKNFYPAEMPANIDMMFYSELDSFREVLVQSKYIYNRCRNYATKKDFKKKEIFVDFDYGTFLQGWSSTYDHGGCLLIKDNKYYLGVVGKNNRKSIAKAPAAKTDDTYKYVNYHLLVTAFKNMPHMFMTGQKFLDEFPQIVEKHKDAVNAYHKHKKDSKYEYTRKDEINLINYYKECLKARGYYDIFHYHFRPTEEYASLKEFYEDIDARSYNLTFDDIDASYIDNLVEKGDLYLFEITNHDLKYNNRQNPDLFTLYFMIMFENENIKNPMYRLNGQASMTFRKKSISRPFIHKAGTHIKNKTNTSDKKLTYDIIKDRRYTMDQFMLSLTFNTITDKNITECSAFNTYTNEYIRDNYKDMHVIGITRGNKNLLYYTVVDMKGNIVEHDTLNTIKRSHNGIISEVDYASKLEERAKDNIKQKQEWNNEYTIKGLKDGYMAKIMPVITNLMFKYNAIVVLEDLSDNFKNSQKALENTVYTDFENALVNKLRFIVNDKNIDSYKIGSIHKPIQLAPVTLNKQGLRFQNGFLFFLSPMYTSFLDPSTGFVNHLNLSYTGKEAARQFVNSFDSFKIIGGEKEYYEFEFDFTNFKYISNASEKTRWTANTKGKRQNQYRDKDKNNQWVNETVDLTEEFNKLFEAYNIDTTKDILAQIVQIDKSALYKDFYYLLKLTFKNNNVIDDKYIYTSPIKDSIFNDKSADADCIGAYNMARKGLIALKRIKDAGEKFVSISTSIEEWVEYNYNHPLTQI